jgi:ribosomal protein S12 methylthiotransferase accessory factor
VRPGGHVLQVTNGKGLLFAEAARGALCEAAELWCAERVDPGHLSWADDPRSGARFACRVAHDLASGEEVRVPAALVHVLPEGGPLLGLSELRWTSNGMGAHPRWEAALLHALLEAVERDQLARALPEGWTEAEVARRMRATAAVERASPQVARLAARLRARGLEAHLFDLAPRSGRIGLPLAGALVFDGPWSAVPVAAGYACRLDLGSALLAALLEASQSRLTDIHGAREDVTGMPEADVERLRRACARPPRHHPALDQDRNHHPDRALDRILRLLRRAGHRQVLALDLAPPRLTVRVAKVVVPTLRVSGLL